MLSLERHGSARSWLALGVVVAGLSGACSDGSTSGAAASGTATSSGGNQQASEASTTNATSSSAGENALGSSGGADATNSTSSNSITSSSTTSSSTAMNSLASAVSAGGAGATTLDTATATGNLGSTSGGGTQSTLPDRSGCKRGVAYGYHSEGDLTRLSPAVSFWYNWDFRPDEAWRNGGYQALGVEYVPMIWGAGSDLALAETQIPEGAQALLGFNEPNFGEQANLSAAAAAALWPELEALADARGLDLVSPAVNFCGGNCQDTDPFNYLHEFLAACTGCRVDAIAMHIYVGCAGQADNQAQWLVDHVERYKSEFSQPLWLTEFACSDATSEAEQLAFMQDAVPYLESEPRIARYAWFSGRADNVPYVDLLGADAELTELGNLYVSLAQNPACQL